MSRMMDVGSSLQITLMNYLGAHVWVNNGEEELVDQSIGKIGNEADGDDGIKPYLLPTSCLPACLPTK